MKDDKKKIGRKYHSKKKPKQPSSPLGLQPLKNQKHEQ